MLRRNYLLPGLLLFLVLAPVPALLGNPYYLRLVNVALIRAVAVLGLNFVTGMTGQISIAQAAFYGLGAYTSALITIKLGLPFWAGFVGAATVSALAGLLIGIPTLRLRGPYLAFATISLGAITQLVLLNWKDLTGGAQGLKDIPPAGFRLPVLWGGEPWLLDSDPKVFYLIAFVLLVAVGIQAAIQRSKIGRGFLTVLNQEVAADSIGLNPAALKSLAFTLGSMFGGAAGSLYAHTVGYISPDSFGLESGILFITMLIVGGNGTILGSILGAVLVTFLPEWLRFIKEPYMVVYATGVLAIVLLEPGGLVGVARRLWRRTRGRVHPAESKEAA